MTKKDLTPGRTYFGLGNRRLTFLGFEKGKARVRSPISFAEELIPIDALIEHAQASDLRTYTHLRTGETRTKVRIEPAEGRRVARVVYRDDRYQEHRVTETQWAKWRANA